MTARNHVLGGGEATFAIARVTWRRTIRGKALWVVLALCVLPELFAMLALEEHRLSEWRKVLGISTLLMAVLPPVLLAGTIGDEIEERTMAYLWSRPLPRWSILTGKLLALVPLLALIQCAALALPFFTALGGDGASHPEVLAYAMCAVVGSTIACAAATTGIATVAPRFGVVLAMAYLVVLDVFLLGGLDAGVSKISIAWNTREVAGVRELAYSTTAAPQWDSLAWLAAITVAWMSLALWRIRRIE